MKKLAAFLTVCLLLALFPASASAAGPVQRLFVNGVDILASSDREDPLGDGSVSFDPWDGVLTLNNAVLTESVSGSAWDWAEHPTIYFSGRLTIHLIGDNEIQSDTHEVMGEPLRDNAIVGDKLCITAEPGATLKLNGMIQVRSYTQRSGTVTATLYNRHSRITKWAMYLNGGGLNIEGGTLALSSLGTQKNGAILSDREDFRFAPDAVFYESDSGCLEPVDALSIPFDGLCCHSLNRVKIVLPDITEEE